MKIIHGLQQGSPEWLSHRRTTRNASDAPAMMGASPYVSRAQLVHQYATGIEREIDEATQRLFDRGHEVEPALRAFIEAKIGEDLYPVTAISDDGYLGCSLDGITFDEATILEAKQSNATKLACIEREEIPPGDYWQIVHQFAVCDSTERCYYVVGDGTPAGTAYLLIARATVEADIPRLIAGWQQFDADVAAYVPPVGDKPTPTAAVVEGFGALSLRVEGRVLASNLDAFKAGAEAFIARLPKPADLQTDQDFADADAAVKACAEAETRIKAAKDAAIGQMADVDAILRTADTIAETIRAARLALDKAVKAEKEHRKDQIVRNAADAVRAHYDAINATLGEHRIQPPQSLQMDLGGAIKGLKTLASMRDKLDAAVAQAKIAASQTGDRVRLCIEVLREHAGAAMHLFPDRITLALTKQPDDLRNLVAARIAEHERQQAAKLEAERERIRAEEAARIEREQRETELKAAAAAIPDTTPAAEVSKPAPAPVHSVPVAADRPGMRIKLGHLNAAIAPLSITADGLAQLGIHSVGHEKAAKLYDAADFPRVIAALQRLLSSASLGEKAAA